MAVRLELLSPAGNAEIGMAAVDHGADAVYIGAPKFSARAEAGSGIDDIGRLIQYAHLYYAKVYVALNTTLTDSEMPEAVQIIRDVFELGADGIIIQDPGLLETDLPPIPLIASTQMHNNTVEKIQFLEAVGFKRIILPREFSLEEIAAVRKHTRVELEAFVYGSLCVSYSGQCYMSQAITGRSGNRGVCTQPCRSRYTLTEPGGEVVEKDRFILSLKDLNLMGVIPGLVAAGVTSFKIEGRYKSIDYVKNVTAAFRQSIDQFISSHADYSRSSSGTSDLKFSPDPARTFNRGFTKYFINGRREKVGSIHTQKSIGKKVGTITAVGRNFFQLGRHDLENGDGLCFFTHDNDLVGFRVNQIDKDRIYPNSMQNLKVGISLYRNHDAAFTRILKKSSAHRRIAVEMDFRQQDGMMQLTATDEDGNMAAVVVDILSESPRDPSCAREQIRKQLSSTGNTIYKVRKLKMYPEWPGFIPIGTLNSIRRDVLDSLSRTRLENYRREVRQFTPTDTPYPEASLDFRSNVLNDHARNFYKRHRVMTVGAAFEALSEIQGRTVMSTRYCIRDQFGMCSRQGMSYHAGKSLRMTDRHHTYRLEFDCRQCQMHVILEN